MSQIEIPDWVVKKCAGVFLDSLANHQKHYEIDHVAMRNAICAALDDLFTPSPQFGDASSESEWFDGDLPEPERSNPFYKTRTVYLTRKEPAA